MAKLAALGGSPVVSDVKTNFRHPVTGAEECDAIIETLKREKWCRLGVPSEECQTLQFEREWEAFQDVEHCIAVCNGSVALMCAYWAVGVSHGDEVIVPAITFVATSDAVALVGGIPVFVDVDPETYQIDADAVEAAITERTKAICVVHYAGYPVDLDRIGAVAKKHGLPVVEDCSHAHGTQWRGKGVGARITAGTFSFQQAKIITSGEGGAVVTNSSEIADRVWAIHDCGRARNSGRYTHESLGCNFRLSEWESTMLRAQLKRLPEQIARRASGANYVNKYLATIDGLQPLKLDERVTRRGYFFYVLRYDPAGWGGVHRNDFIDALCAEGIPAWTAYGTPVYQNPSYVNGKVPHRKMDCPVAEDVCANGQVVVTGRVFLNEANAPQIVNAISKVRENIDELRKFAEERK